MLDPAEILGPDGPMASHITGFVPRPQQQEMAAAVAEALDNASTLIAEAGTGTGKTFAYLVPALASGLKVIVSTGTKNLQDQLFHKDLPLARKALELPVRVALLKGRANYLCLQRMAQSYDQGRFRAREQVAQFHEIRQWAGRTRTGDIAELDEIPEGAPVWSAATSTADNCLGQDCPEVSDCFVMKARRAAQEADVVVVNHHLFFADMALRDEGVGELLPGANAVIFDEAHQLPEIASTFFGVTLTSRQLNELVSDTLSEVQADAAELLSDASAAGADLEKAVADLRLAFGTDPRRAPWQAVAEDAEVCNAIQSLADRLTALEKLLETAAARGKGLENCYRRCQEQGARLARITRPSDDQIHWFETHTRAFALHMTPMDIGQTFRDYIDARKCAWVFTSATLAVDNDFRYFTERLGLTDAEARQWDSPFEYARISVLYVPPDMPDPSDRDYTATLVERALPVLEASKGRAFMLFTSYRAMDQAADLLEGRIDFPVLVQGSMPRARLLERFRALGNAVLLGTASFWEGVDVRGEALSCVIIDKLPFAAPDDPVLKARIDAIRSGGGDPFRDFQLPNAVIQLRQGVGRLVRDEADRGVMMIGDPRLISRYYGRVFLDSLPRMTRTRRLEVVQRFFALEPSTPQPVETADT